MPDITTIREVIHAFYKEDRPIAAAWVAGSGTMALDERNVIGIPEVLDPKALIGRIEHVQTRLGTVPNVCIMDIGGLPVLRIRYHGWSFPVPSIEDTIAVFYLLHCLSVPQVVTDASVGGLTAQTWDVVIPNDVITNDNAKVRVCKLVHGLPRTDPWVRMASPFCPRIGNALEKQVGQLAKEGGTTHPLGKLHRGGIYYTMPLNPFETPAEIQTVFSAGADIVGQSSGQEALAARLCNICFGVINPVANTAEGLESGVWTEGMTMLEYYRELALPMARIVFATLKDMVQQFKDGNWPCPCTSMYNSANLGPITRSF